MLQPAERGGVVGVGEDPGRVGQQFDVVGVVPQGAGVVLAGGGAALLGAEGGGAQAVTIQGSGTSGRCISWTATWSLGRPESLSRRAARSRSARRSSAGVESRTAWRMRSWR